jgi:hypothetical protein
MENSYKQAFLAWAKRNNVTVLDSLPDCPLHKGQKVTFTNDYGASFENQEILGFTPKQESWGGRVYLDKDSYWFPVQINQLTPQE